MADLTYSQRRTRLKLIRDEVDKMIDVNDRSERKDNLLTSQSLTGVTVATEIQEMLDDGDRILTSIIFAGITYTNITGGLLYTDGTDNFWTRA